MNEQVLNVVHLKKVFGKTEVLQDVSMTVLKGEVYGLVGQNGAGKTTLLRLIAGLIKPTGGNISVHTEKNFAILEKGDLIYSREVEGRYVIKTEPIPSRTYEVLAKEYSLVCNENRTVLYVKTDKKGVSELVKALTADSIGIFEVSSSNDALQKRR